MDRKTFILGLGIFTVLVCDSFLRLGIGQKQTSSSLRASDNDSLNSTTLTTAKDERNDDNFHFPLKESWIRPPIDAVLNQNRTQIVGNVSGLLDFAILGEPKCGTSYLMYWLQEHEQTSMFPHETCLYQRSNPVDLVEALYELSEAPDAIRGFKCPTPWKKEILSRFPRYFPQTRLVVGLRHPVDWFKSYYDFRNRHPYGETVMPNATTLIGSCRKSSRGVCTDRANFHQQLDLLGKTKPTNEELALFTHSYQYEKESIPNPIFLYDVHQLGDSNTVRQAQFIKDLQNFVGLSTPLPEPPFHEHVEVENSLEICNDEYKELRMVLVDAGRRASEWIRRYFLKSPSVYVSNRRHFLAQLDTWKTDPCATV